MAYYIQDPDRFARILRQTVSILDERISDDKAELRKMKSEESAKTDITYRFDFDRIWIFDNGFPRLPTGTASTISQTRGNISSST